LLVFAAHPVLSSFIKDTPPSLRDFSLHSLALVVALSTLFSIFSCAVTVWTIYRPELVLAPSAKDTPVSCPSAILTAVVFSLACALSSHVSRPSHPTPSSVTSVTWRDALLAEREGRGLIVDTRTPGTEPDIPSSANIDPDSTDDSLREFCAFASGKKIFLFCASASCGISETLAARISKLCPLGAQYIEGGAESWSP
jgi:rhodanese-related sulfurtransferase